MRKRHWLACLLIVWMSVVGGQAFAQPPNLPNNVGNPDQTGMLPPPYATNYGTYPPPSYGGMPAGYPPGANAWPNVGPYGPQVDQTANQGGLWFNRQLNAPRKYYFNLEGLLGHTSRPISGISGDNVNIVPQGAVPGNVTLVYLNQQFEENPLNFSLFTPDRATDITGAGGGGNGGGNGQLGGGDLPVFAAQSTGSLRDLLNTGGMRGTWGWWNADQSGFTASGFALAPVSSSLFIGDPYGFDPYQFTNAIDFGTLLLAHLHAVAGIPLQGADTDANGLPGVVQPFDIYYRLQYTTQVAGANADWYSSPLFERPALVVRPVFGARYLTTKESFQFDGADSGLGYTIGLPSSGVLGGGNGGNGGGNASIAPGYLSPTVLEGTASTLNIMKSELFSSVSSQLAGPEAGLRFDIGKERFKIWTQSKFGLLANYTQRNLSGYNIGDAYYTKVNGTVTDPTVMPRNNAAATRFAHEDSTTILSPMFEQSIFAKANIFQFIPVLNKSKILNGAEFQAGYTIICVGNTYRPTDTITWQAYPTNPYLNDQRSSFVTSNFSFGVQWDY